MMLLFITEGLLGSMMVVVPLTYPYGSMITVGGGCGCCWLEVSLAPALPSLDPSVGPISWFSSNYLKSELTYTEDNLIILSGSLS